MSYNVEPLRTVRVMDPILDYDKESAFAVFQGGNNVSYRPVISTNFSNNSCAFSAPPPNPGVAIDRTVLMRQPVSISMTADGQVGEHLWQSGESALRAFPLSQIIDTLNVRINNTSVSMNMADVIEPLLRTHTSDEVLHDYYSMTPSAFDMTARYQDLAGWVRNPLSSFGDITDTGVTPRGGFPVQSITNAETSCDISFELTEPLMISPLLFGGADRKGLIGVQTFQVQCNYVSDLARGLLSIDTDTNPAKWTNLSIQVTLGQPELLFKYITPKQLQQIPRSISYDYYQLDRYNADLGALTSGSSNTFNSQNIQLQSIPKQILIWARRANNDRGVGNTDSYAAIDGISLDFNNRSGLLASATRQDLYRMSVRNGLKRLSWGQWSGDNYVNSIAGVTTQVANVGSILSINPALDLGLSDMEANGLDGTYNLRYTVQLRNEGDNIGNLSLYTVVINDGTMTILDNRAVLQVGVISREDILNSQESPYVGFDQLMGRVGYGMSYADGGRVDWQKVKDFGKKAFRFLKEDIAPIAKQVLPLVVKALGGEQMGGDLVELPRQSVGNAIAFGAGAPTGGKRLGRRELERRMKRLAM